MRIVTLASARGSVGRAWLSRDRKEAKRKSGSTVSLVCKPLLHLLAHFFRGHNPALISSLDATINCY